MTKKLEKLLVCSHNQGKLKEFKEILQKLSIELVTPNELPGLPDPVEDGDTFLANAQIKARAAFAHTGLPSIGDDSGLVVPALNGDPGLMSARYSGVKKGEGRDAANRRKLMDNVAALPLEERKGYFICTMVLCLGEGQEESFVGRCHGEIILEERGENGFGYDPIFLLPEYGKTFAEIPSAEKHKISHRGLALEAFQKWLRETQN